MERLLFECAVRAIFIAGATAFALWAMRIKTATERHRAWFGVVLLMLVLPVWTALGPDLPLRVLPARTVAAAEISPGPAALPALPAWSGNEDWVERAPIRPLEVSAAPAPAGSIHWMWLLPGIYLAGAFIMLLRLAIGTVHARRLIRNAVVRDGRLTSAACTSPITVGWIDPVVILPMEWRQWPADQLKAILTHECEHVSRYHPFAQWLALLNRAIFWFHPLAWWLERRVSALAEESCDAAVLAAGHSPQDYSEYLLNLARAMMRDRERVRAVGMAMPGSSLDTRIRQILAGIPSQRLSITRVGCTIACCTISAVVFGAASLSPRELHALDSAAAPVASSGLDNSLSIIAEQQTTLPSTPQDSFVINVTDTSVAAHLELAEVSSDSTALASLPPSTLQRDLAQPETVNRTAALPSPPDGNAATNLPVLVPSTPAGFAGGLAYIVNNTQTPGVWWTDTQLGLRLGLTAAQRARIEEVFEKHRQNIASSRDRLRNEEAQQSSLLQADPVNGQVVLAQIDRVVQARGEMQRASAAMNLEVRGYLSPAQWMQLRAQMPITTIDYVTRVQLLPVVQVRP